MFEKMNFLALMVDDLPAATRYYQETLGLTVDEAETVPNFYTQFKLGDSAIFSLMNRFPEEGIAQSFDAALKVKGVDALYADWQTKGVNLLTAPTDMPFGRTFLFQTPDGHVLRVYDQG